MDKPGLTETGGPSEGPPSGILEPNASTSFAPLLPDRIPSLDGLRAISILLVIAAHCLHPALFPTLSGLFGHIGNYGVRLFFLISGFLITTLLLKEFGRSGTISIRNFYMRRTIRIFPAFYIFFGVVFYLYQEGYVDLLPGDLLHAATYTMNYHQDRAWALNHTWSLAVEEQFYFLWPAVLLLAKPRKAIRITVLVILAVPLIRLIMYVGFHATDSALSRHFQAVCDALATGCLLAGVYNTVDRWAWYRKLRAVSGYFLFPIALLVASGLIFKVSVTGYYVIGQTVANLGGILLLDYAVRDPDTLLGKLLNTAPLRFIGLISYSLYLWQEVLLDFSPLSLGLEFPLNLVTLFATATVSYYCIEKQFFRLRKWFLPSGTTS